MDNGSQFLIYLSNASQQLSSLSICWFRRAEPPDDTMRRGSSSRPPARRKVGQGPYGGTGTRRYIRPRQHPRLPYHHPRGYPPPAVSDGGYWGSITFWVFACAIFFIFVIFIALIFAIPKDDDDKDNQHHKHAIWDDDDGADDEEEIRSVAPWGKRGLACPSGTRPYDRLDAQTEGLAECVIRAGYPKAIDLEIQNPKANPCQSFEAFSCGRWAQGSSEEDRTTTVVAFDRGFTEAWTWNLRLLDHVESVEASRTLFPWDDTEKEEELLFKQMIDSCVKSSGGQESSTRASVEAMIKLLDSAADKKDGGARGFGWVTAALAMHGIPSVLVLEAHRNPTNRREPLLYLEQWGSLGASPEAYHKRMDAGRHKEFIAHACSILKRLERLPVDVESCATTVLSLEKRLLSFVKGPDQNVIRYLRTEFSNDLVTHGDFRHVVGFEFAAGFYEGLSYHMDSNLFSTVSESRVWLHNRQYFERLGRTVEQYPDAWSLYLRVAIVSDAMHYARAMGGDVPTKLLRSAMQRELYRLMHTRPGAGGGEPIMPWNDRRRSAHMRGHVFDHTVASVPRKSSSSPPSGMIDPDSRPRKESVSQACIKAAALYLPEAVDDTYAAAAGAIKNRHIVEKVVHRVLAAMILQISSSPHLDEETRQEAVHKARSIIVRVATPWKDRPPLHKGLILNSDSFYANSLETRSWHISQSFAWVFDTQGISESFDDPLNARGRRARFDMANYAVNAYYDPSENSISILAGIMRSPFFDSRYSNISLYATMGAIVGHELSHAFDSNGIWFDSEGDARLWLSREQVIKYIKREQCYVRQYESRRTRLGNLANGTTTLGENIADGLGLRAAYAAAAPSNREEIQEFLTAYAQMWCARLSPEEERKRIETDEHSVPEARINGAIRNLRDRQGKSPLETAYDCKPGDSMVPKTPCSVW